MYQEIGRYLEASKLRYHKTGGLPKGNGKQEGEA